MICPLMSAAQIYEHDAICFLERKGVGHRLIMRAKALGAITDDWGIEARDELAEKGLALDN